jgi:hypothetical protein
MTFSRNILFFIIATIPVLFAAVQPWIWSFYTTCVFAAFLILLWQNKEGRIWHPPNIFIFTVGVFFVVTLCQILPLPESVLSFLSPFRFKVLAQARSIISNSSGIATLSYAPLTSLSWWIFLLGLFLFFLVFQKNFFSDKNLKILVRILLCVAFLEAIYGIIQALIPSLGVLWVGRCTRHLYQSKSFRRFYGNDAASGFGLYTGHGNLAKKNQSQGLDNF